MLKTYSYVCASCFSAAFFCTSVRACSRSMHAIARLSYAFAHFQGKKWRNFLILCAYPYIISGFAMQLPRIVSQSPWCLEYSRCIEEAGWKVLMISVHPLILTGSAAVQPTMLQSCARPSGAFAISKKRFRISSWFGTDISHHLWRCSAIPKAPVSTARPSDVFAMFQEEEWKRFMILDVRPHRDFARMHVCCAYCVSVVKNSRGKVSFCTVFFCAGFDRMHVCCVFCVFSGMVSVCTI